MSSRAPAKSQGSVRAPYRTKAAWPSNRPASEPTHLNTVVGLCRLARSRRRTLGISVLPDASVELTAPMEATLEEILAKVGKRALWIEKQRRQFLDMNATRAPLRYCSGATHRYLGKQYRLKVAKAEPASVKLSEGVFWIQSPATGEDTIRALLDGWFRSRARSQFARRLEQWNPWIEANRLPAAKLHIRAMPKRWGSAHPDGKIYLNPDLVRMPSICIDYVIAHEICHLKRPSHDSAFYRLLGELFPNWRATKARLEQAEL